MKIIKGHKFWLRPTADQEKNLIAWQEQSRVAWNSMLDRQIDRQTQRETDKSLKALTPYCAASNLGTKIGRDLSQRFDGYNFPSDGMNGIAHCSSKSWDMFWKFVKNPSNYPHLLAAKNRRIELGRPVDNFCKPKFKKYGRSGPVLIRAKSKIEDSKIRIANIGWVRLKMHYALSGNEVKNVSIRRTPKRWVVSFQTEEEIDPVHPKPGTICGVDLGCRDGKNEVVVAAPGGVSDRKTMDQKTLDRLARLEIKSRKLRRSLARKREVSEKEDRKVSKNYVKTLKQLSIVTEKAANIRKNFVHHQTAQLADTYEVVAVEELNVAGMTVSAKGSVDKPGTNVSGKAELNRLILGKCLATYRQQLSYKTKWRGGKMIAVDPANTSRTCPKCRHVDALNRKGQNFKCKRCGHTADADDIGAENILAAAHAVIALDSPPAESMCVRKDEPRNLVKIDVPRRSITSRSLPPTRAPLVLEQMRLF